MGRRRTFDRQEALALNLLGMSDTAIARKLDCSQTAISSWRCYERIPMRRACWACGEVFAAPNGHYTHCGQCGKRKCSRCKRVKPVGDFAKNLATPDGINNVCKSCGKVKYRERGVETKRRYHLKSKYRLTPEEFRAIWIKQGKSCWFCKEPLPLADAVVDHDHACQLCGRGEKGCSHCVRGLAHPDCNRGVGSFGESPARLRAAADALELWAEERGGEARHSTPPHPKIS